MTNSNEVPAKPGPQLTDYRLQQRDYLLRIARAMSERLDLSDVLKLVIRSAVAITGGQAGAIAMRQGEDHFELAVSYQLEEKVIDHLRPVLAGAARLPGPAGADGSAAGGELLSPLDRNRPEPSQQVLALPLRVSDEVIGQILIFRSEGAAAFTPLDGELLQAFADQAAVAIQNAQLHGRLAARERQLAAIVEDNPAALLLADREGRVVTANPALEALTGCTCESTVGVPVGELIALVDDGGRPLPLSLPTGPEPAVVRGHLRGQGTGRQPYVQVTITALTDPEQVVEAYVASIVDLTAYREAEGAKRTFLAGLSHELKTPLALIRGYAETLRYPQVRTDEALFDQSLDVILAETGHLTQMVEELLTAARFEAGALSLDLDEVSLGQVLERLVDEFGQAQPSHRWQLDVSAQLPVIVADRLRLRQVFQNLLSNAVKYSPAESTILVSARSEKDHIRVAVRDEGIGLTAEERQQVFDRFYRASDRVEGTGLGLYMARTVVAAHGGTITVDSAPGAGSTFTVALPLAPLPERQAAGVGGAEIEIEAEAEAEAEAEREAEARE